MRVRTGWLRQSSNDDVGSGVAEELGSGSDDSRDTDCVGYVTNPLEAWTRRSSKDGLSWVRILNFCGAQYCKYIHHNVPSSQYMCSAPLCLSVNLPRLFSVSAWALHLPQPLPPCPRSPWDRFQITSVYGTSFKSYALWGGYELPGLVRGHRNRVDFML